MAIFPVHSFSQCQLYFVLITCATYVHDGLDKRQMIHAYFLENP
jgi:hypothetical protein